MWNRCDLQEPVTQPLQKSHWVSRLAPETSWNMVSALRSNTNRVRSDSTGMGQKVAQYISDNLLVGCIKLLITYQALSLILLFNPALDLKWKALSNSNDGLTMDIYGHVATLDLCSRWLNRSCHWSGAISERTQRQTEFLQTRSTPGRGARKLDSESCNDGHLRVLLCLFTPFYSPLDPTKSTTSRVHFCSSLHAKKTRHPVTGLGTSLQLRH